jgi:hypothetical protein
MILPDWFKTQIQSAEIAEESNVRASYGDYEINMVLNFEVRTTTFLDYDIAPEYDAKLVRVKSCEAYVYDEDGDIIADLSEECERYAMDVL